MPPAFGSLLQRVVFARYLPGSCAATAAPRGGIFRLSSIEAASTTMTTESDTYTGIL